MDRGLSCWASGGAGHAAGDRADRARRARRPLEGLDGGADDYIVKPVAVPELLARCRAVLRRPGGRMSGELQAGRLRLDTVHREAALDGNRCRWAAVKPGFWNC